MMHYLPGYVVHNMNIRDEHEGKEGHGIAVLTAPSCADHVCFLRLSEHLRSIWLKCDKCMFGLDENVALGASYINPQSADFSAKKLNNITLTFLRTCSMRSRCPLTFCFVDYGQPSYVGYHKDRSSRPDHILLSPAVAEQEVWMRNLKGNMFVRQGCVTTS
eukprot:286070-Pelagomonas_calceolata.AAC.1